MMATVEDDRVAAAKKLLQEKPDEALDDPVVQEIINHDTLKYHLLGPSLTKAGQDAVDQQKVSEIIYNASKGSKFFNNEEVKDRNLTEKIDRILVKKRQLDKLDMTNDLRRADEFIVEMEMTRDLSQHMVHIDCDAFYAAVEELDNPSLKDVPMAVGKGVLTTCNYHARKFGCRSGMAGFVAMKLCPELICLPLNFEKYTAKAQEVRAILAEYDPRFESASIDEAYLNVTKYCEDSKREPEDVVSQMRAEVHEKTKITISAGIAANGRLAKIASNQNKPNGQFKIASDRTTIMAFIRDLPTRKINGVGRVFERELDAIGIKTCGDIYEYRAFLSKLFGEKAFQFLVSCYLGLGRTRVKPAEEHERKSVGTESTFRDMSDKNELRKKLQWLSEELEKDLHRTSVKGKTLVLKIKLHTYEVLTRQTILPKAINVAEDLYKYSLPMLTKLEKEIPGMTLRLMGLRVTHIISTKKENLDFFGSAKRGTFAGGACVANNNSAPKHDEEGWELWPEEEFEEQARQERQIEMDEIEKLSQELELSQSQVDRSRRHGREVVPNPKPNAAEPENHEPEEELWSCPVCHRPQKADDRAFNEHIDYCLSKQVIQDTVKAATSTPITSEAPTVVSEAASKKRGRPQSSSVEVIQNKRLFFTNKH